MTGSQRIITGRPRMNLVPGASSCQTRRMAPLLSLTGDFRLNLVCSQKGDAVPSEECITPEILQDTCESQARDRLWGVGGADSCMDQMGHPGVTCLSSRICAPQIDCRSTTSLDSGCRNGMRFSSMECTTSRPRRASLGLSRPSTRPTHSSMRGPRARRHCGYMNAMLA